MQPYSQPCQEPGHAYIGVQIVTAAYVTENRQLSFKMNDFPSLWCSANFIEENEDETYSSMNLFLWLRRDVDELKLISDDKNYDEMYAASSLTRRDGTKLLFEDYQITLKYIL